MNIIIDDARDATHYWLKEGAKYPLFYRFKDVEVWNAEGTEKEIVTRPQYFGDFGWTFHTNENDEDVIKKLIPLTD